jgi:hypothetical protein
MADIIRISPASLDALKTRLATPEGRDALLKLANLIAQSAAEAIPPDLRGSLRTKEGMAAFRAAWPDIVEAFLFRGLRDPEERPETIGEEATAARRRP